MSRHLPTIIDISDDIHIRVDNLKSVDEVVECVKKIKTIFVDEIDKSMIKSIFDISPIYDYAGRYPIIKIGERYFAVKGYSRQKHLWVCHEMQWIDNSDFHGQWYHKDDITRYMDAEGNEIESHD